MQQLHHKLFFLSLALILSAGCGLLDVNANVESDTSWSGSFDGRTVDGSKNQTINMGRTGGSTGPAKCAVVQKKTSSGFLTLKIGSEEKTTTAAFGVVSACD